MANPEEMEAKARPVQRHEEHQRQEALRGGHLVLHRHHGPTLPQRWPREHMPVESSMQRASCQPPIPMTSLVGLQAAFRVLLGSGICVHMHLSPIGYHKPAEERRR